MTLLTPPRTSHRDRDHRLPVARVAWSQQNQYFILSASPKELAPLPARVLDPPCKSILKKTSQCFLPVPEEKDHRDITPEPEDPLVNLTYLVRPVAQVINRDSSLSDLIEAYSILNARIRAGVASSSDSDASWPLFQPLRKHTQAFVDAVMRDLGRALVDPSSDTMVDEGLIAECKGERENEQAASLLPSPQHSPKKKKKGMSATQVKWARDLCTVTHVVLRLLSVVFVLPSVYQLFSEEQLHDMLTHVLAIPMAESLPTPNARKTCALSIWLLQMQRLPEGVLFPARDRIAFALRRGMEGELGKEGKKGSACDGLKAIHDLSLHQPSTFVPPFIELLPSVLSNLLAPTLGLRAQACHALGGFVLGCIALPQSLLHARISKLVSVFLTTPTSSPLRTPKGGTKEKPESLIVRTLRTTLNAVNPTHVAHGPVWSLSVLACLIVLLGSKLYTDVRLTRIVSGLLALAMRNRKSSVRAIGCLLWRCLVWVYMRSPLLSDPDSEGDVPEDDVQKDFRLGRENLWRLIGSVVDMGTGVSTVVALLSDEDDNEERMQKAFDVIEGMIQKGGQACEDGMEITRILVSFENTGESWTMNKLLPHSLFSSHPGLLTADYNALSEVVKPIFEECPQLTDVRSLTREELSRDWVFDELVEIWRIGVGSLEMTTTYDLPDEITGIWEGLLKANVALLLDVDDQDGIVRFAIRAAGILADLLGDHTLDFISATGTPSPTKSPTNNEEHGGKLNDSPSSLSNLSIRLRLIRELWTTVRTTFPNNLLHAGGARLLWSLLDEKEDFIESMNRLDGIRTFWAALCAETLVVCDVDKLCKFWARNIHSIASITYTTGFKATVWRCFIEKWKEDVEGSWEGGLILLGAPFDKSNPWEMTDDDLALWEEFLQHTMDKASDNGVDVTTFVERVAEAVGHVSRPVFTYLTHIMDLLLRRCEFTDVRQLPLQTLKLVNDALHASYPQPINMRTSLSLLATLAAVIAACPKDLRVELLKVIQDGICLWLADECGIFSDDIFELDLLPLYEVALRCLKEPPVTSEVLSSLAPLLHSVFRKKDDTPLVIKAAFTNFWTAAFPWCDEPAGGWPEGICSCLEHCDLLPNEVAADKSSSDGSDLFSDATVCASPDTVVLETPRCSVEPLPCEPLASCNIDSQEKHGTLPILGRLRPASFSSSLNLNSASRPMHLFSNITLRTALSTPIKKLPRASTPPRPHKPAATPESYQSLILRSPTAMLPLPRTGNTPSTPKRPHPKPMLSTSPSKKIKLHNKENVSPPLMPSITERITEASPRAGLAGPLPASVLGKRQSQEESPCEVEQDRSPSLLLPLSATFIRSSIAFPSAHDSDLEEELAVEASLCSPLSERRPRCNASLGSDSSPSPLRQNNPISRKRKRQRLIMDAVVVPSLVHVRRGWKLQRRASADGPGTHKSSRLHRTPSLPVLTGSEEHVLLHIGAKLSKYLQDAEFSETSPSVSPLKMLEQAVIAGSDDSIILAAPTKCEPPSSDDDPHIGQVSPRHLVSPAPRRRFDFECDLSSGGILSSPSRDVATRRRRRSGAATSCNIHS